jgi:hypothetical protein
MPMPPGETRIYEIGFATNDAGERVPLSADQRALYGRHLAEAMAETALTEEDLRHVFARIAQGRRRAARVESRFLIVEAVRVVLADRLWRRPAAPFRNQMLGG